MVALSPHRKGDVKERVKQAYGLSPRDAAGPQEHEEDAHELAATWRTSLAADEAHVFEQLLDENMRPVYGDDRWLSHERATKQQEAQSPHARFLVLRSKSNGAIAAVCHYRFVDERGTAALYVYELQVARAFMRQGVGSFALVLLERLAAEAGMAGMFLTVQRSNAAAFAFYQRNGFALAHHSPGAPCSSFAPFEHHVLPMNGNTQSHEYEILCKLFNDSVQHLAPLDTCREERRSKRSRKMASASAF